MLRIIRANAYLLLAVTVILSYVGATAWVRSVEVSAVAVEERNDSPNLDWFPEARGQRR